MQLARIARCSTRMPLRWLGKNVLATHWSRRWPHFCHRTRGGDRGASSGSGAADDGSGLEVVAFVQCGTKRRRSRWYCLSTERAKSVSAKVVLHGAQHKPPTQEQQQQQQQRQQRDDCRRRSRLAPTPRAPIVGDRPLALRAYARGGGSGTRAASSRVRASGCRWRGHRRQRRPGARGAGGAQHCGIAWCGHR